MLKTNKIAKGGYKASDILRMALWVWWKNSNTEPREH